MKPEGETQSFWDHLDELRTAVIKCVVATLVCAIVTFLFKDILFTIILAPKDVTFITYRLLAQAIGNDHHILHDAPVELINTGLARQFIVHIKAALCTGIICASPYILYQLFRFVSPALYSNERLYVVRGVGYSYLLFALGMAVCYFLIFPLTFRFLGTYRVSHDVVNMISLDSYISTLMTMSLAMGIVFEIPVLCLLFAHLGLLSASFMRQYRRHTLVIILILAAVITPTSDLFTLTIVSLPMYILYELSICIVCHIENKRKKRSLTP